MFWGAFTGSKLLPGFLHMPGAVCGREQFYLYGHLTGQTDDATVSVVVHPAGDEVASRRSIPATGLPRTMSSRSRRIAVKLLRVDQNDEMGREDGATLRQ